MVTTEWAVPHAAGKFVRNLAGAESDGAWTVVRADLCKGLESGVYVNIDEVQVRRMFDSERTLWYSCYKEQERQAKFEETISTIVTNLQEQSKEVTRLVDAPIFPIGFSRPSCPSDSNSLPLIPK
jgi:hypothetical protein